MTTPYHRFTHELGCAELDAERAFNQYSLRGDFASSNRIRRRNLRLYLDDMAAREPDTILVGEAPSHRGARLTGIAFLSESLMLRGIPDADMFGEERGYRKSEETEKPSTEASASIVWETIASMRPLPLLWNAFPFHPHEPGNPRTNRDPSRVELEIGGRFVKRLIRLFGIQRVVAIGNHADRSLTTLGIEHIVVRHPSQGGKPRFVAGVRALVSDHVPTSNLTKR